MRRILVHSVAVVVLALVGLTGCTKKPPVHPEEKGIAADEGAPIRITMVGNQCRVLDAHFLKVWSARGRTVRWTIKGECSNVREISVGQFTLDGKPVSPITIRHSARPTTGSTILATVNNDAVYGVYRYVALFDGAPAGVRVLGGKAEVDDDGEFEVCPNWPCS